MHFRENYLLFGNVYDKRKKTVVFAQMEESDDSPLEENPTWITCIVSLRIFCHKVWFKNTHTWKHQFLSMSIKLFLSLRLHFSNKFVDFWWRGHGCHLEKWRPLNDAQFLYMSLASPFETAVSHYLNDIHTRKIIGLKLFLQNTKRYTSRHFAADPWQKIIANILMLYLFIISAFSRAQIFKDIFFTSFFNVFLCAFSSFFSSRGRDKMHYY